jgi:hypothetical protein
MPVKTNRLIEDSFKSITGDRTIKYEKLYPRRGKGAFEVGSQDDIYWEATLVKKFTKDETDKDEPTGDISSLKLLSRPLGLTDEPRVRVVTKIDFCNADTPYVEERIKRALKAQQLLKWLAEKKYESIRSYAVELPFDYLRLSNVDMNGACLTINHRDKNGKKPQFPLSLTKKFGDYNSEKSEVRASAVFSEYIRLIIPPLDFQIGEFEVIKFK